MALKWVHAQWCLSIWNPGLMDWVTPRSMRNSKRLYYKTMGVVTHDRALNGRPAC